MWNMRRLGAHALRQGTLRGGLQERETVARFLRRAQFYEIRDELSQSARIEPGRGAPLAGLLAKPVCGEERLQERV
jgi:hypothetical protein